MPAAARLPRPRTRRRWILSTIGWFVASVVAGMVSPLLAATLLCAGPAYVLLLATLGVWRAGRTRHRRIAAGLATLPGAVCAVLVFTTLGLAGETVGVIPTPAPTPVPPQGAVLSAVAPTATPTILATLTPSILATPTATPIATPVPASPTPSSAPTAAPTPVATPTAAPTPAATPVAVPPTATPPLVAVVPTTPPLPRPPTPQRTADPHALTVANITQSINDNRGSLTVMEDWENLKVSILAGDKVYVSVKPTYASEYQVVQYAAGDLLIASKAMFGWYPKLRILDVTIRGDFTDPYGTTTTQDATWIEDDTGIASKFDYNGMQWLPADQVFCDSSAYEIHPAIWKALTTQQRGCMTSYLGPL